MFRKATLLLLLLCSILLSCAQISEIDSVIKGEMGKQHIVGISVGIVVDGHILLDTGYGLANITDSIPVTGKTVFKIGSLSKHIIATCIMALAEQNKIKLSDPVRKYFKGAPSGWDSITIRNLLNHTSGIERESPLFDWMKRQPDLTLIQAVYKDTLLFSPGTQWKYSNMGYFMLADIIRQVTGQSFEKYMNDFFVKCHLEHTTTTTLCKAKDKALGYRYNKTSGEPVPSLDFVALRPSGAFSSSMEDMIKWDSLQVNSNILTKGDWAEMFEDTVREGRKFNGSQAYYGYGWSIGRYEGHRLVHHDGSTLGFTTEYLRFVDDGISIIILTNTDGASLARIAKKIAQIVIK
jgi:CubicO group peptidase (beta-lactamase class C family)